MKAWWNQLAKREQNILIVGSIIVGILLIYQFIYRPYQDKVSAMSQDINRQQELVLMMQDAKTKIDALQKSVTPKVETGGKSLLSLTAETLEKANLSPSNIGQAANQRVRVKFDAVSFNALIKWLIQLWQQFGIQTYSATMNATKTPGVIEANLILEMS